MGSILRGLGIFPLIETGGTERDEGPPGGGKSTPIDWQMSDSRLPIPLSAEAEKALTEMVEARSRKDAMLRTFHRSKAQVLAGQGTFHGDETDGEDKK